MKGQLPPDLRQARCDAIMEVQQEIAFRQAASRSGEFLKVLIDAKVREGQYAGRHSGQAPEVDAVTYVLGKGVKPGEFVRVLCQGSQGYDLIARPTEAILPILSGAGRQ